MSNQSNLDGKPWYRSIPDIYYVCGLIAMAFGLLKFLSNHIKEYLPIPNEIDVHTFQNTFTSDSKYLWVISLIQVIIVSALVLSSYIEMRVKTKQTNSTIEMKIRMNNSLRRLVNGLALIAVTWILLYSWFTFFWAYQPESVLGYNSQLVFWIGADILHTFTAYFFFFCFTCLEFPDKINSASDCQKNRGKNNLYVALLSIGFLIFSIAGRSGLWSMDKLGPILLSFWVALSMQFFFGKLDSFDLRVPRILIAPLYLYILLQMMWSAISGYLSTQETTVILILTLLFKTYFLLLFQFWIRSNTFNRYFERFARDPNKPKKTRTNSNA